MRGIIGVGELCLGHSGVVGPERRSGKVLAGTPFNNINDIANASQ